MNDLSLPHNRDKVLLQLEVGNLAMIGQLLAAGDVKAQQVLGGRWLEIGFAACSYAGTVMDTSVVQQEFKQLQRELVTVCHEEIVDAIVHQFSLDNGDGILAHLVKILQDANGELVEKLSDGNTEHHNNLDQRIAVLSRQLSTDYPDSALSKLVRTLSDGNQKIAGQLTLDDPKSPLSRMQGKLVELLRMAAAGAQQHQQDVAASLASLTTRREADAKSPQHGITCQARALAYYADFAGRRGHVFENVSCRPGLIPRCKTGDGLFKVGPDYLAKGAPFVVEVKDECYSVPKMLAEIEEARKNRGTTFGVFVIKAACAPAGMPDLKLYGNDTIVVKWDDEDPATDVYLDAAADIACALATRELAAKGQPIDFTAIDRTINSIEKKANGLGQIFISATTIKNAADKILDESKPKHAAVITELVTLRDLIAVVRTAAGSPASDSIVP